jgi:hypothetical protein
MFFPNAEQTECYSTIRFNITLPCKWEGNIKMDFIYVCVCPRAPVRVAILQSSISITAMNLWRSEFSRRCSPSLKIWAAGSSETVALIYQTLVHGIASQNIMMRESHDQANKLSFDQLNISTLEPSAAIERLTIVLRILEALGSNHGLEANFFLEVF